MRREQKANTRIFSEHFFLFSVLTRPLHTTISEYTHFNPCFAFLYSPRGLHGTVNHSQIILNIYTYILCSIWTYVLLRYTRDCDLYALCSSTSKSRRLPEKYSARYVALPTAQTLWVCRSSIVYLPTYSGGVRVLLCHIVVIVLHFIITHYNPTYRV